MDHASLSRLLRAGCATTAAACLMGATPASASVAAMTPASALNVVSGHLDPRGAPFALGGWLFFRDNYPLTNSTLAVVRGTPGTDGGCAFDDALTVTGTHPALLRRTRATAVGTCLEIVETGVPPASVIAAYDQEQPRLMTADGVPIAQEEAPDSDSAVAEATDTPTSGPPIVEFGASQDNGTICTPGCSSAASSAAVGTPYHTDGYSRSWYQDPIGIDVNSVRNELAWDYSAPVGVVTYQTSYPSCNYYGATGWSQLNCRGKSGFDSAHAWISTYARFRNDDFCKTVANEALPIPYNIIASHLPQTTTWTYYDRAVARGHVNGNITENTRFMKKGTCAILLSKHDFAKKY